MVSSKKSSTESKTKQAETSKPKPATKSKTQTNGRKPENNDSNTKTKKNNSSKKHSTNGSAKEDYALVPSVSGSDSEEEVREDRVESTSKKANNLKSRKIKQNHGKREVNGHEEEEEEEEKIHKFPMHRIKMIMRDEDSDMRINHEALFLVNKASEMFLSQFCKDAYTCCAQDRKKALAYKHLSSVVFKRKRYEFLSDFVPEKLKLEDALKEREMAETGRGQAS